MRRIGVWVFLFTLFISLFRIWQPDKQAEVVFSEQKWKGFVYRAPWNRADQLTVLGEAYSGVLWTMGYGDRLVARLEVGCYVEFSEITFRPGKEKRNPGTFCYRTYLKSRNIDYVCSANEDAIHIQSFVPARYWLRLPGSLFRSYLRKVLRKSMTEETFGLLQGVMTGDVGGLPEDDATAFQKSGLSHLMAVSGTHVTYFLLMFRYLLRRRTVSYKWRHVLLLIPLFAFWGIADYTPSVTRAVWMTAGLFFARILERPPDSVNMLTLSASVQMWINPFVLTSAGFLMSYGASCGLYWVAPLLYRKFPRLKVILAGVAVQIVLTPLMLYLFGTVSLCGVCLTVVASLPAGILCTGGYVLAALSFIPYVNSVCRWIAYLLHALCKFLLWVADVGAGLPIPFGQIRLPGISLWWILFFYCFMIALFVFRKKWKQTCALCLCASFLVAGISFAYKPIIKVLFADVGQGSAAIVQADGYAGLVDTGDGSTNLEEVLYGQGITKLDFVVLTHGHSDHTGGLEEILRVFEPAYLYVSENQEAGLVQAKEAALQSGSRVCEVTNGSQLSLGEVTVTFIVSANFFNRAGESMENNASLNVHFACKYGSVLICGDMENDGEVSLQDVFSALNRTDILLVPHHGSKNGCSENLLSNILPKYAIISVGMKNAYGHPAQETLTRLANYGVRVYRTDHSGGISVTIGPAFLFRKKGIEVWQTL